MSSALAPMVSYFIEIQPVEKQKRLFSKILCVVLPLRGIKYIMGGLSLVITESPLFRLFGTDGLAWHHVCKIPTKPVFTSWYIETKLSIIN